MVATESEGKRADAQQDLATTEEILEFTGNWFIDAGILGFVKLMEEVYGWDLRELRRRIDNNPNVVYYGYFPFAYFYKWCLNNDVTIDPQLKEDIVRMPLSNSTQEAIAIFSKVWWNYICKLLKDGWLQSKRSCIFENELYDKRGKLKQIYNNEAYVNKVIERSNLIEEINQYGEVKIKKYDDIDVLIKNCEHFSERLKTKIKELEKKNQELLDFLKEKWDTKIISGMGNINPSENKFYRLPIDDGFYKNFLFFNSSKGILEQKDSFYNAIQFNIDEERVLEKIDKTINKLLPSTSEFPNIFYTELSTEPFQQQLKYLLVYLLCFKIAFENYGQIGNVLFYSNDIEFAHKINTRLKAYKQRLKNSKNLNVILNITWQQIFDLLVEYKSSWALENMYIISYRILDNQNQENVEYIGIPKLQAAILVNDTIRENLNKSIQWRVIKDAEERYKQYSWLIMDFIKGKPLFPIILGHTRLAVGPENLWLSTNASLYALAVEANVKKLRGSKRIFGEEFFGNQYADITRSIREDIGNMSMARGAIDKLYPDENEKKSLRNALFGAVASRDKNAFLNILVKSLNEKITNKDIVTLLKYNYINKILKDDQAWEYYALPLVFGLIRTGEREEGESHGDESDTERD